MSNSAVRNEPCLSFIWRLDNLSGFIHRLLLRKAFESPPFIVEGLHNCRWFLRLHMLDDSNSLRFELHREWLGIESGPISIEFELSFLDDNDKVLSTKRVEAHSFKNGDYYCWEESQDFMIPSERFYKFLPEALSALCLIWKKNNEVHENRICHAQTRFEVEHGTFTWCVKNFGTLQLEEIKRIHLTTISRKIPPTTLKLYLHGKSSNEKFQISATQFGTAYENILYFHLEMMDGHIFADDARVFKRMAGLQVASFESSRSMTDLMAKKDMYLINNDLILKCKVVLFYEETQESVHYEPFGYLAVNPSVLSLWSRSIDSGQKVSDSLIGIKGDLQSLCKEGILTDVNLIADGKKFPAHKNILIARSPVLRAMFTSNMKKTSACAEIFDFGAETVQHLLKYLYTDTVEDLQWNAMFELYEAADKYKLLSLKEKCSLALKRKINTSNACDLLVLSDLHLDDDLKSFVRDFIMDNDREIMGMDEWNEIEKSNLQLFSETLKYFYSKTKKL